MSRNTITGICAIIVSHNRPTLLRETIESVTRQTLPCDILIIDNASGADTVQIIKEAQAVNPNLAAKFLTQNIGGAGGFHEGLKEAWRMGYGGFWLMDDDTIAGADALGALVAAHEDISTITGRNPSFVCSNVRWVDGSPCKINVPVLAPSWLDYAQARRPYLPVRHASFVSLLIARKVVEKHGLPLKEYFIWFDDSEYTYRISRDGNGAIALNSIVIHKTSENTAPETSPIIERNAWKYEFGNRNKSSFTYREYGFRKFIKNLKRITFQTLRSNLSWEWRWKLIYAAAKGIRFSPDAEYVGDDSAPSRPSKRQIQKHARHV
ncbi:glycosyltransferase [Labrys sp. 22185]|uniref:glycosyltransferase n=1 Tax=Labrys sp. 22185 TaxID=3453888 RepID=UPI003F857416